MTLAEVMVIEDIHPAADGASPLDPIHKKCVGSFNRKRLSLPVVV